MTEKIVTKRKYHYAVGRRKSAIAQVRIWEKGKGEVVINDKKMNDYLPDLLLQQIICAPLKLTGFDTKVDVTVVVRGGGKRGQAEAIRHGIARALQLIDLNLHKTLKVAGFLTRDARIKERKKPGLKRARRAPQWQKR
jgi:small subunit ribosomal protein S9